MLVYQRVPSEICAAGDDSTGDLLRLSQQSTDDQISRRSQWGNGAKKTLGCFRYGSRNGWVFMWQLFASLRHTRRKAYEIYESQGCSMMYVYWKSFWQEYWRWISWIVSGVIASPLWIVGSDLSTAKLGNQLLLSQTVLKLSSLVIKCNWLWIDSWSFTVQMGTLQHKSI